MGRQDRAIYLEKVVTALYRIQDEGELVGKESLPPGVILKREVLMGSTFKVPSHPLPA